MKKLALLITLCILTHACSDREEAKQDQDTNTNQQSTEADNSKETENGYSRKKLVDKIKSSTPTRDFFIQDDDIVIGNRESNVVVVEYFAMTCPHCHGFLKRTFPKIKKEYIDTNKIAYVFREFVGNKQDLYASSLARCGRSTESYINFMEVLLSQQNNWAFNRKFEEVLTNIGSLGGISPEEFSACIADEEINKTLIENTKLPLQVPGFVGTPTFFVNGKHVTKPCTFEELSSNIEAALKESKSVVITNNTEK